MTIEEMKKHPFLSVKLPLITYNKYSYCKADLQWPLSMIISFRLPLRPYRLLRRMLYLVIKTRTQRRSTPQTWHWSWMERKKAQVGWVSKMNGIAKVSYVTLITLPSMDWGILYRMEPMASISTIHPSFTRLSKPSTQASIQLVFLFTKSLFPRSTIG